MDKKVLIAFVLALLVIIYYPRYLKQIDPPTAEQTPGPAAEQSTGIQDTPPTAAIPPAALQQAEFTKAPETPERELTFSTPLTEVTFSSHGGTIKKIRLLQYQDQQGNPLELVTPLPVRYRPLATNIPENILDYRLSRQDNTIICTANENDLKITKTYLFSPDSYIIQISMILENTGTSQLIIPGYNVSVGAIFPGSESQAQIYLGSTNLIDGKAVKNKLGKKGWKTTRTGRIFWSGLKSKYFAIILKPETMAQMVSLRDYELNGIRGVFCEATLPQIVISAGGNVTEPFILYAGPKKHAILKTLGFQLDQIMDFGMLAPISKIVLYILNFFYGIVHNYGFAIILLTILVKIILYPLTLKSYKSMREMHKVQPLVQELQKKYKSEPKRMQKEMMLLYKEHKVNPFSGCFPMLLQMPILIALFTSLRSAIELRGAPFILWITDLSEPDTIFRLSNGFPINILPIFLLGTFFIQQKMTTMPATTEQQQQQQKMMRYIMPLFMGFIFYKMPSGLVLYFALSTLLGIMDQYRIEKSKK